MGSVQKNIQFMLQFLKGELLHYMDPTLPEGNYDTVIVHIGINDIINDDRSTKVENIVLNLEKIVIKLKNWN